MLLEAWHQLLQICGQIHQQALGVLRVPLHSRVLPVGLGLGQGKKLLLLSAPATSLSLATATSTSPSLSCASWAWKFWEELVPERVLLL